MADHSGNRQSLLGLAILVVIPLTPGRISHDGLPDHFVESNLLGRVFQCRGNRNGRSHALRVGGNPLEYLHAPHGSAGNAQQFVDT